MTHPFRRIRRAALAACLAGALLAGCSGADPVSQADTRYAADVCAALEEGGTQLGTLRAGLDTPGPESQVTFRTTADAVIAIPLPTPRDDRPEELRDAYRTMIEARATMEAVPDGDMNESVSTVAKHVRIINESNERFTDAVTNARELVRDMGIQCGTPAALFQAYDLNWLPPLPSAEERAAAARDGRT